MMTKDSAGRALKRNVPEALDKVDDLTTPFQARDTVAAAIGWPLSAERTMPLMTPVPAGIGGTTGAAGAPGAPAGPG